jgi:hypothetical protein
LDASLRTPLILDEKRGLNRLTLIARFSPVSQVLW